MLKRTQNQRFHPSITLRRHHINHASYQHHTAHLDWFWSVCFLTLHLLVAGNLWAANVRQTLTVQPSEVYKSMLGFCETKQFDKIEPSISPVKPLLAQIGEDFNIDLESDLLEAIASGQQQKIYNVVRKLIFWDMKALFAEILTDEEGASERQVLLQAAYGNYLLLSPEVKRRHFSFDRKLRNDFKQAKSKLRVPGSEVLKTRSSNIETMLLSIFPHFKNDHDGFAAKSKAKDSMEATGSIPESLDLLDIDDIECLLCHGDQGKGDGTATEQLFPKPRDFTKGLFKIRSTLSGHLPTNRDLFDTITNGIPGTSMPSFEEVYTEEERWQLVEYVKSFNGRFKESKPVEIDMSAEIPYSEDSVRRGKEVYVELECNACHGDQGRGDGKSANDLKDEWGRSIRAADLTHSWNFRGGAKPGDIFKRLVGGMAGTPMPSFLTSFQVGLSHIESAYMKILEAKQETSQLTDTEQAEYTRLEAKILKNEELLLSKKPETLTSGELERHNQITKSVHEKLWDVANYVKSLTVEDPPKEGAIVRAEKTTQQLPSDAYSPMWDNVPTVGIPLIGQVIVEPQLLAPTVDSVWLKALYNDEELALLIMWNDATKSEPHPDQGIYSDAVAVQFPVEIPNGSEFPDLMMGDAGQPVNVWHWDGATDTFQEIYAAGIDDQTIQSAESQSLQGHGSYERGRWRVVVKRSLKTDDMSNDLQFEAGRFIPIAFSVWDGTNGDRATKKAISTWAYFILNTPDAPLEPPEGSSDERMVKLPD